MAADDRMPSAVNALRRRLEALEAEKREFLEELARLQLNQDGVAESSASSAPSRSVTAASEAAAKVKLFRSLSWSRGRLSASLANA